MTVREAARKLREYYIEEKRVEDMDEAVDTLLKFVDTLGGLLEKPLA